MAGNRTTAPQHVSQAANQLAIDELKVGDNLTALTVQEFSRWLAQPSYEDFTPPTRSHSQHWLHLIYPSLPQP